MVSKITFLKGKKHQIDIREITNNQETMRWRKKVQKLKQLSLEHFIVYT